jgi:hypothetical protein
MSERQVRVTLVIDEKGAVRAMRTAGNESEHTQHKFDELDKHVKGLGKSFGGLKSMIGYGLGGLGVGALAFGLKDVVNTTKSIADETERFHAITGMGAGSSLSYVTALKARGIGAQAGGNAFKFLAKNIEAAERQEYSYNAARGKSAISGRAYTGLLGIQAGAFQQLGINVAELRKLKPEDQFKLITERFEGMKDGAEKTALATQLFGRGGTTLLPVLDKGSLSLKHYTELTKKFFPSLKGEGVKALDELREKQSESNLAWEGLQFTLGMEVVPTMTKVMGTVSELAIEIEHGKGAWGTLGGVIGGVVGDLKEVVHWGEGAAKFFGLGGSETPKGAKHKSAGKGKEGHPGSSDIKTAIEVGAGLWGAKKAFGLIRGAVGLTRGALSIFGLGGAAGGDTAAAAGAEGLAAAGLGTPIGLGLAASLPIGYGAVHGLRAGTEALSPGYLKRRTQREDEEILLRGHTGIHRMAYGPTQLQGTPAKSTPSDEIYRAILDLRNTLVGAGQTVIENHTHKIYIGDRQVAEAVTHYAQKRAARK